MYFRCKRLCGGPPQLSNVAGCCASAVAGSAAAAATDQRRGRRCADTVTAAAVLVPQSRAARCGQRRCEQRRESVATQLEPWLRLRSARVVADARVAVAGASVADADADARGTVAGAELSAVEVWQKRRARWEEVRAKAWHKRQEPWQAARVERTEAWVKKKDEREKEWLEASRRDWETAVWLGILFHLTVIAWLVTAMCSPEDASLAGIVGSGVGAATLFSYAASQVSHLSAAGEWLLSHHVPVAHVGCCRAAAPPFREQRGCLHGASHARGMQTCSRCLAPLGAWRCPLRLPPVPQCPPPPTAETGHLDRLGQAGEQDSSTDPEQESSTGSHMFVYSLRSKAQVAQQPKVDPAEEAPQCQEQSTQQTHPSATKPQRRLDKAASVRVCVGCCQLRSRGSG